MGISAKSRGVTPKTHGVTPFFMIVKKITRGLSRATRNENNNDNIKYNSQNNQP
jgi:hypothetical protein